MGREEGKEERGNRLNGKGRKEAEGMEKWNNWRGKEEGKRKGKMDDGREMRWRRKAEI